MKTVKNTTLQICKNRHTENVEKMQSGTIMDLVKLGISVSSDKSEDCKTMKWKYKMTQNEGEQEHSESFVETRNHMEDPPYCAAYIRELNSCTFLKYTFRSLTVVCTQ